MWFIMSKHECFVIDPGAQGQKVARFLTENELDIKAILLTHGHFDHIGAVDYLYNQYHCPIYTQKESRRNNCRNLNIIFQV